MSPKVQVGQTLAQDRVAEPHAPLDASSRPADRCARRPELSTLCVTVCTQCLLRSLQTTLARLKTTARAAPCQPRASTGGTGSSLSQSLALGKHSQLPQAPAFALSGSGRTGLPTPAGHGQTGTQMSITFGGPRTRGSQLREVQRDSGRCCSQSPALSRAAVAHNMPRSCPDSGLQPGQVPPPQAHPWNSICEN